MRKPLGISDIKKLSDKAIECYGEDVLLKFNLRKNTLDVLLNNDDISLGIDKDGDIVRSINEKTFQKI